MVGFKAEPNCGRGTIGLLWSCLATVLLCTFSALHLNVPETGLSKAERFGRIIAFTIIGVLVPEYNLMAALEEFVTVRRLMAIASNRGKGLTAAQAHLILMEGLQVRTASLENEKESEKKILITSSNFMTAIEISEVNRLLPTKEDIKDRSKADFLGRFVTIVQILWFLVQVIARHVQGETVSLLEVSTLAYISLALISYGIYWRKPQGMSAPIRVYVNPSVDLNQIQDEYHNLDVSGLMGFLYWAVSFAAFAGVHLLAWDYAFPSETEKWLWRVASLLMFVFACILAWVGVASSDISVNPLFWGSLILFVVTRLCLIVQSFLVIRSSPKSVYSTVNWPSYFPAVG
jgi:succinate dehydrogenase/fumarate reductase cytochrome b subunit